MDSRVRGLAIFAACSVIGLAFLIVWYVNRPESAPRPAQDPEAVVQSTTEDPYRAFLKDETFFDPEPRSGARNVTVEGGDVRVYLTASSVMRDIRITIQGEDGKPVEGESFYVHVDPLGEYKDLDRDGLIYIPDVTAGDYFVKLTDTAGYLAPEEPMKVTVRSQLEYSVIDDIRLYVHTEDEVNAAVEDVETKGAANDADETERTDHIEGTDGVFGIDVSKYQGEIDWNRVAADGVDFAIIRCGYRGCVTGALVEDPYFKQNIEGALGAGLDVGVYFFTQAVTEVEAVEEASMAAMLCQGYRISYPIFIDVETGGGRADGLDVATRTAVVKAFCETINNAGYHGGVYACKYWFNAKMSDAQLSDYSRWLAEWRGTPTYNGDFRLWQYTSSGTVDGINTRVDLDLVWNGSF